MECYQSIHDDACDSRRRVVVERKQQAVATRFSKLEHEVFEPVSSGRLREENAPIPRNSEGVRHVDRMQCAVAIDVFVRERQTNHLLL